MMLEVRIVVTPGGIITERGPKEDSAILKIFSF